MAGYAEAVTAFGAVTDGLLGCLHPEVRAALREAGVSTPGTLAELGAAPLEELADFYKDLLGGLHSEGFDAFRAALQSCEGPAKRARRAFAVAPPETVSLFAEERVAAAPPASALVAPPAPFGPDGLW